MDYYVIDFEAANSFLDSACSIGIVGVSKGKIALKEYYLINPHQYFLPINISIHGITADDVKNEMDFRGVWEKIHQYFENTVVFAHNSAFDMAVLKACLERYELEKPTFLFGCTVKMSQIAWDSDVLENHKLNTVAEYLEVELDHHNALSDSIAAASIVIRLERIYHSDNIFDLYYKLGLRFGTFSNNRFYNTYKPLKMGNSYEKNKSICLLGVSQRINRIHLVRKILANGYYLDNDISEKIDYVVVLQQADSKKMQKLQNLILEGIDIKIINEEDLMKMLV